MIVSPTTPEFDAKRLNAFIDSLISSDFKSSARDAALTKNDGGMNLGRFYFDEIIGTIKKVTRTTITTTEPETIQNAGRKVGDSHSEWEAEMKRRTWVRVYPDPISATTVFEYEKGVANGTVEPNNTHGYAQHWLESEQVRQHKEQYNKFRISKVVKLFQRGR